MAVGSFEGVEADPTGHTAVFLTGRATTQPSPLNALTNSTLATPVRGWNSYDRSATLSTPPPLSSNSPHSHPTAPSVLSVSYGSVPTEAEILLNAQSMQRHLLPSGYRLISLDWGWWLTLNGTTTLDVYGRFQPGPDRFPSSTPTLGFRPLSDRLHAMGLLFGIYTNAGFSIYFNNTGPHHIPNGTQCVWSGNDWDLDVTSPLAQEWLDGVVQQWVDWGVDYVKIDCIGSITSYQQALMYSTAIARSTNPNMRLAISPGWNGDLKSERAIAGFVSQYRLQVDFHDLWDEPMSFYPSVPQQVAAAAQLEGLYPGLPLLDSRVGQEGGGELRLSFGDLDALPFGWIYSMAKGGSKPTWSAFNQTQQQTVFSIFCFYRTPLIYGGSLIEEHIDPMSLAVVTNSALLHIHEGIWNTQTLFDDHTHLTVLGGREEWGERFILKANINSTEEWVETLSVNGGQTKCDWREAWTGRVELGIALVTIRLGYSEVNVWTVSRCGAADTANEAEQRSQ